MNKKPEQILKELEDRFFDIPFENSDFQNEMFVLAAQHTPARAYRSIGLKMFSKIEAIKELKYKRMLEAVEIEELQAKIDDPNTNSFERRKAEIEIERRESMRGYTNKLLNDAIHELDFLYAKLQQFPEYTREQFELEEKEHFERRLSIQMQTNGNGSAESLYFMQTHSDFEKMIDEAKSNLELPNKEDRQKRMALISEMYPVRGANNHDFKCR